jgi:hypothetical protein
VKCDISRSHHTRFTGGVKCDATPKRHRWCHSLVGADHYVGSQRQYTRQAVSSEHREKPIALLGARSIGTVRPGLRTSKVGDSSGTPTRNLLHPLAVIRAPRFEKPMSIKALRP